MKQSQRARLQLTALLGISCLVALSASFSYGSNGEDFEPSADQGRTTLEIVQRLSEEHYRTITLDDGFSSGLFDRYLDFLDPSRSLFRGSDVEELARYRFTLDDGLREGQLEGGFAIFNRFQERRLEQIECQEKALAEDLEQLSFEKDESIEIDRSERPRPATAAEQQELYRRRFKNEVLGLRLTDRSTEEMREILGRRHEDQRRRVGQTKAADAFNAFINAFARSYDPHTDYLPPLAADAFDISMSLKVQGIGALLGEDGEYVNIQRLIPAGPAEKGGELRPSDRIVAVAQGDGELKSIVGWRAADAAELIRGPRGSVVRLLVLSSGQTDESEARVIAITRDEVKLEEQAAQGEILEIEEDGVTRQVGVIELPTFYLDFEALRNGEKDIKSSTRDVAVLLQGFIEQDVDTVVLDLRNNGGGSLVEAQRLTGLFLGDVPVVQVRNAQGQKQTLRAGVPALFDGTLVVLVNRFSASASEILAAAIQDHGRGVVVGGRTWGKGTVQNLSPITEGQLKLTQAKFYRVSGSSTQNRGVVPDIAFPSGFHLEDLGESALENALPWDSIRAARGFQPRADLADELSYLAERHTLRVAGDPEFTYLASLEETMKVRGEITHLSLKESQRRKEQEAARAELLAIENERRVGLGLEPFETYDDAASADADEGEETDPAQREAARIAVELHSVAKSGQAVRR